MYQKTHRTRKVGQGIFGAPAAFTGWGILLLLCCILVLLVAAATLGFAISTNSMVKNDARLVGGGSKCDDGNPCTRDLRHVAGGCVHHYQGTNHRCHNPCFVPDDPDPEDDDEDWGHRCDAKGNCVGWQCCGDCKYTRNCPDIQFKPYTVAYADKDCQSKGCVYSAFAPILLETPCHNPFATEICTGFLDKEFNKTQCLKVTPVCEHPDVQPYTRSETREGNGHGNNVATIAFCLYDFECTEFCPPKIIVRGDGEVAEGGEAKEGLQRLESASEPMRMDLKRPTKEGIKEDSSFDEVIESYRAKRKRV